MGAVVNHLDHKRRARGRPAPPVDAVIAEIPEALTALGDGSDRRALTAAGMRRFQSAIPAARMVR